MNFSFFGYELMTPFDSIEDIKRERRGKILTWISWTLIVFLVGVITGLYMGSVT